MESKETFGILEKNLGHIFEGDDLISEPNALLTYYTDASQIAGNAKYVVFPKQIEQLRRLIILATKQKQALVPRGSGTDLVGSAVPEDGIVVDFSRMTKIFDFDRKNKTITVEPGVILEKLNNYLKNFDLFFPVIPSSHNVCTIGGMVATNAAGSKAIKYGKTSDNVLEVELLDGQGKTHTIKDASIFGTEGTIGFITKIKLELKNLPKERSLTVYTLDNLEELKNVLPELKEKPNITAIEFVDKKSSSFLKLENKYHLIVEYDDMSGDIKEEEKIKAIWEMRESLRTVYGEKRLDIIEDPYIPEEKLPEFIEWIEMNEIPSFGHLGVGIMHLHFSSEQKRLIDKMLNITKKLGGNVSGEHGIGILKKKYLDKTEKNKIMLLKQKYDPKNIMNPGKMISSW
ncbi:MAG: FAD-binding oxidoreductase [Candidatus Woesearchaeota archaeon]